MFRDIKSTIVSQALVTFVMIVVPNDCARGSSIFKFIGIIGLR